MTAGRRRVALVLLLLAPTISGPAMGSFERLPGPAPGGEGSWLWDWPTTPGRDSGVRFAIGTPAAVDGLGWSQARARASIACFRVEADAYLLGLDDLYRETALGVWLGRGILTVGARRWDVAWKDDAHRAGWALSTRAAARVGPFDVDFATQDIAIGGWASSAPMTRFGGGLAYRASPLLRIGGSVFRGPSGPGCQTCVRWSPVPEIGFREAIRVPGRILESGIEVRAARVTVGLWLEPSLDLGSRIGISCAFE